MQAILTVTLPFFALVMLGFVAAQRRLLPEAAIPGLNAYVLFFALPCLLFRFGASMSFAQLIAPALVGIYALSALLVVGLTVAITWRRRALASAAPAQAGCAAAGWVAPVCPVADAAHKSGVDLKNAAFGALVAAFPNSGFMGVPLLVALFGEAAAGPVIGTLLVDLFLTSTLCLALAHVQPEARLAAPAGAGGASPSNGSVWMSARRSLRAAATNPQPWAIALGAVLVASGAQLPGPVAQVVKMLADSASPVALFTIGAVLWRAGQHAQHRTPVRQFLPVALVKLFVHPLLVGSVGLLARAAGLDVPAFGLMVLVLTAALPSASNVSLLAERYGADNGRVARIIMASTVLAFGSFTLLAWGLSRVQG
jgi:predicted permease